MTKELRVLLTSVWITGKKLTYAEQREEIFGTGKSGLGVIQLIVTLATVYSIAMFISGTVMLWWITHTLIHTQIKIKYIIQGLHTVLIFFINWSSCIQGMKKRCNKLYPSPLFRCFFVLFLHIHNYHINVFLIHNTLSTPMTAYLLIPKDKLQQEVILTTHFQVLSYMCYLPRYISLQLHINNNKNPPYCKSKTNMSNICFILKSAMLLILGWNTVWILNVLSIIFFSPESSMSDWVM